MRKTIKTKDGISVYCSFTKLADPKKQKPHPENTHRHPASQIELLGDIIAANGWRETITVSNRSGLITRGHARNEAAIFKGWKEVPIERQTYHSAEEELADLIADTRIKEFSSLSDDKLRKLIARMKEAGADLARTALAPTVIEEILRDYQRSLEMAMLHPAQGEQGGTIRQVILLFDKGPFALFTEALRKIEAKRPFASISELLLELLREHENNHAATPRD